MYGGHYAYKFQSHLPHTIWPIWHLRKESGAVIARVAQLRRRQMRIAPCRSENYKQGEAEAAAASGPANYFDRAPFSFSHSLPPPSMPMHPGIRAPALPPQAPGIRQANSMDIQIVPSHGAFKLAPNGCFRAPLWAGSDKQGLESQVRHVSAWSSTLRRTFLILSGRLPTSRAPAIKFAFKPSQCSFVQCSQVPIKLLNLLNVVPQLASQYIKCV
ncbi:hypothetical protein B0H14DRAFT_3751951 [Mycena olivaceomarginata]|nr:hypothetical protein B0H14DRAFT_3751951 [Mycena olivaceomarginata]